MFWQRKTTIKSRLVFGVLLSVVTLGTTVESASAQVTDLLGPAVNLLTGKNGRSNPVRELEVFNESANGNNVNFCISPGPCALPSTPNRRSLPPQRSNPQVRRQVIPSPSQIIRQSSPRVPR